MLTALLGVGFWAVCGRLIKPAELGVQTALLSIIVSPGIVLASGVGDALTAVLPSAGASRHALLARGYRSILISSAIAGAAAAVIAVTVLPQVRGSIPVALSVFAGVMIWSFFVVQDAALTSMRRAHWLPIENGTVSAVKIALVPVGLALGLAQPVVVANLVPAVLAIAILYPRVRALGRQEGVAESSVSQGGVSALRRMTRRTTSSVALSLGTLTLTPFLVTAAAGPIPGAVFSLALSVVQSLDFVGAALGVSLVVHASASASGTGTMARAVFWRASAVVGGGAVALVLLTPFVLRLVNPIFLDLHGVAVISVLAVGSVSRVGYVIWAGLQRARRNMRPVLIVNGLGSAVALLSVVPAAQAWGAVGAAVAVASAQFVLTLGTCVHLLAVRGARHD